MIMTSQQMQRRLDLEKIYCVLKSLRAVEMTKDVVEERAV